MQTEGERISLSLPDLKVSKILIGDVSVSVQSYIDTDTKVTLIKNYISLLEQPDVSETIKFVQAEYSLILGILDLCTNIDVTNYTTEQVDKMVNSYFPLIANYITNYSSFREELKAVLERENRKNSFEKSLQKLVEKAEGVLDKIMMVDFSEEGVSKLVEALNVEAKKAENIVSIPKEEAPKTKRTYKKKETPK